MIVLGLTGSIGMGKSTTARMFGDFGIPVHDADQIVHQLYAGEAAKLIEKQFPGTTGPKGVDRQKLTAIVVGNEAAMKRLEAIVHPLVSREKQRFLAQARGSGATLVVLDIPLLFETGGDKTVDGVVVVTAPADVQRTRVLSRADMDAQKFEAIVARQYPDDKKRQKADFIIDTSLGMDKARQAVSNIIEQVASGDWRRNNRNKTNGQRGK